MNGDSVRAKPKGFFGGGLGGGTWAYQRANGTDDLVSYRSFRLVLGWESSPPSKFGPFASRGTKWEAEVGYVFGRQFEFDSAAPDLDSTRNRAEEVLRRAAIEREFDCSGWAVSLFGQNDL